MTKAGSATPFTVNSSGKVANLNADSLDGFDASALRNNVRVFTGAITVGVTAYTKQLSLPAGTYVVSYSAYLPGGTTSTECYVRTHSPTDVTLAYTADQTTASNSPAVSGTGLITQDATHLNELRCSSSSAFTTIPTEPIQVVATAVDSVLSSSSLRTAPNGSRVAK